MPSKKKPEERLRFEDAPDVQALLTTWGPTVEASTESKTLTFRDKLKRHLKERKSSFTTEEIAERFMVSKSTAAVALIELQAQGLVDVVMLQSRRKVWTSKVNR